MRAPHPRLAQSRRLTRTERAAAEASLGFDMSAVCIHTGPVADALADRAGALAFTVGNHIVLGGPVSRMSPVAQSRVVAHELIHVVQQAAPALPAAQSHARPEARGPPLRPFIRGPPHPQFLSRADLLNYAGAAVDTVTDLGSDAVEGVVEFAEDAGDTALAAVRTVVDQLAPGLWDFLSGGALDDMADLLCDGVDAVLGTVFDGIADIDIMSGLEKTFASLATGVTNAQASAAQAVQDAVGAMFEPFVKALEKWGGPLITFIQTLTSAVSGAFTGAWNKVAVPAMDFLEFGKRAVRCGRPSPVLSHLGLGSDRTLARTRGMGLGEGDRVFRDRLVQHSRHPENIGKLRQRGIQGLSEADRANQDAADDRRRHHPGAVASGATRGRRCRGAAALGKDHLAGPELDPSLMSWSRRDNTCTMSSCPASWVRSTG